MRWEELELNTAIWTIPADRDEDASHTSRSIISSSHTVLEKVEGLHSEWVFPPRKQIPLSPIWR